MGKQLIQDIFRVPAFMRGFGQKYQAKEVDTEVMIEELYNRGITIERIFGQYYALEEMAGAKSDEIWGNDEEGQHGDPNRFKPKLTVGDARLAGHGLPKINHEQPF